MKVKVNKIEWLKNIEVHINRLCIEIFYTLHQLKLWYDLHDKFYWIRLYLLFITIEIPLKKKTYFWNNCIECWEKIDPNTSVFANIHEQCRMQL